VNNSTYTNLVNYSGSNTNVLNCPSFTYGKQPVYNASYGYLIGYQYLGGVNPNNNWWPLTSPFYWHSAQKINEDGTNVVVSDANHWGGGLVMAPHGANGPILIGGQTFDGSAPGGSTPQKIGGVGGNTAHLDGSIAWTNMRNMKTNYASSYVLYYGNW
jgi:hypothetical protein